ncbi:hypothetical protein DB30_00038 [Enhygromyxa salina]|uniref:PEGA domain-containing protein n=1 Tax=Enhygromyxa salina TaxID=215803 RepID=A0A0C1ZPF6_9BACT|nr:hypothetical protein DB30_00038 [Enhygromyxa salina]
MAPVEYTGELPQDFRREFEQTLAKSLERAGRTAVVLRSNDCASFECMREAATAAEIPVTLAVRVNNGSREYSAEILAHDSRTGEKLAQVSITCGVCGQQEFLDAIPAKIIELESEIDRIFAGRTEPPRLRVAGTPNAAELTLDGAMIGVSPLDVEVRTGDHQLEIRARNHTTQVHRWIAVGGVEEVVEYELKRLLVKRERERKPRPGLRVGGWFAVSLGVISVGTGAVLIGIDGRPHMPTCAPSSLDLNGACPNVYTTGALGAVALAVGLAGAGTGAGLLIFEHQARPKEPLTAELRLSAGGLALRF